MRPRPLHSTLLFVTFIVATGACDGSGATGGASATATAPPSDPFATEVTVPPLDTNAIAEIATNLPSARAPTKPDGTLIGTPAPTGSAALPATSSSSEVSIVQMQPDLKISNAGSERDLRASLYYALVDQCRDEDGDILPPESVEIEFRVDDKGTIDRSSVRAVAALPEHEAAARCMVRVIRGADARFGPVRLEEPSRIKTKVPSID